MPKRAERHPVAELAPGDPLYRIVRRGNDLVVYGGDTYVLDLDLRSPPRRLGNSWFFIPSAKADRVWLAHLDPASPETVRALAGVREVAVDGHVTFPHIRPPEGRWPVVAVGDHLVFEDHRRGGLELWKPATGFTLRLPGASRGPSHGNLLAWCERDGRTLHITDVGSGRDQAVAPPAAEPTSGSFSSTGSESRQRFPCPSRCATSAGWRRDESLRSLASSRTAVLVPELVG